MEPFLEFLSQRLAGLPVDSRCCAVAFSGGVDSTVLLAAMSRLKTARAVRALHVDHGLNEDSREWERHCRTIAEGLGVEYSSCRIAVENRSGESLEALAREARYRAFGEMLTPRELLLTAHHGDDQLETLLLRLFRGSGVKGLRGIAEFDRLGEGFIARPLLQISREEIAAVGQTWALKWLEDPMNENLRFDRNFLRANILPHVRIRWPSAGKTAVRAARQMSEAQTILDDVAQVDGAHIEDPARVSQSELLRLPPSRQRNLLRHLIGRLGLPMPEARQLDALVASLTVRRADAKTQVQWPGGEARIYRGVLYLFQPLGVGSGVQYRGEISESMPWLGPEGSLRLVPTEGNGLPDRWAKDGLSVRFRVGGERFKPMRHGHSRPLKKWFQDAGVPPWLRGRIPLLYRDAELVAVADLWISAAAAEAAAAGPQWEVSWTDHPPLS